MEELTKKEKQRLLRELKTQDNHQASHSGALHLAGKILQSIDVEEFVEEQMGLLEEEHEYFFYLDEEDELYQLHAKILTAIANEIIEIGKGMSNDRLEKPHTRCP